MEGLEMYADIQKLKRQGYKKQRAARQLELDTKTVRKYWDMSEEEYIAQHLESKERSKVMAPYRDYMLDKLKKYSEMNGAILYDRLREDFEDFSPSYRSVRRYVMLLREEEGLPTPLKIRQYMEVAETPPGFQAQVDMGQKVLRDAFGKSVKVYVFAMVLSNSRYKYVWFQTEPFTAKTFCAAHDAAFRYFGGRTTEIVYDQDRVMVVSKNHGDILYTEEFENYKNYAGFSVHLCRGNDPESKGKIESVVKYVNGNFLSCRVFHGIARLNSEGLAWLDRTGNGLVHETTKMVPKVVFQQEQRHLHTVPALGEQVVIPKVAIVRKNNVVMYRQNRYCMPIGTYRPGRRVRIETDELRNRVRFFDCETQALVEELPLAQGIGKCVRNNHPQRDKKTQHKVLVDKVIAGFAHDERAQLFLERMLDLKPRYTRDQMSMVIRLQERYTQEELLRAVEYCIERELYTASDLGDTLEYFAIKPEPHENRGVPLPVKYRLITAQQRPLDTYAGLVKGGTER